MRFFPISVEKELQFYNSDSFLLIIYYTGLSYLTLIAAISYLKLSKE